jgi:O-antigen ligase
MLVKSTDLIATKSWSSYRLVVDYFWVFFGVLLFIPLEIVTEGLFIGYIQIIILLTLLNKISKLRLSLFLLYSALILFSTILGSDQRLTSLVNPLLVGSIFLIDSIDKRKVDLIIRGVYFSATVTSILLIFLLYQAGFSSIYTLLTSRNWADIIPYFGNGLALMYSMAILFAIRDSKYKLALLFIIAGVLTTSRVPLLVTSVILLIWTYKKINLKNSVYIIFLGFVIFFTLTSLISDSLLSDFEALSTRMFQSGDRISLYKMGFSVFIDNPFFGIGAEKLPYYEHAHNSYLQVAFKYGAFTLLIWLLLIYLAFFKRLEYAKNIDFILVFLILSTVQIGLHHPNVVMLFVIYCNSLKYTLHRGVK